MSLLDFVVFGGLMLVATIIESEVALILDEVVFEPWRKSKSSHKE